MHEIVNKLILAGDTFMSGFTQSAFGLFTKNKERIQKFKETGYSQHIYHSELDQACY